MEIRDFIFPFTKKGVSGLKSDGIAIQFSEEYDERIFWNGKDFVEKK